MDSTYVWTFSHNTVFLCWSSMQPLVIIFYWTYLTVKEIAGSKTYSHVHMLRWRKIALPLSSIAWKVVGVLLHRILCSISPLTFMPVTLPVCSCCACLSAWPCPTWVTLLYRCYVSAVTLPLCGVFHAPRCSLPPIFLKQTE